MTRLPQPGGDNGNWGGILNDYLSQAHKTDGTLKDDSVGTAQLQDDSVTASAIAPGAVTKADVGLSNVDNTADSAKPVSTAQQTALDLKASRTQRLSHIPALGLYFPEAEGAVANGTTDDSAAIIAAEAAALAAGGTLHMQGVYAFGSQIKIRCDADMRRATLNWLGGASSGTALIIGETDGPGDGGLVAGAVWEKHIEGPTIRAVAKTNTGWTQVTGTVGVHISNIYKSYISLVEVRDFEVGLKFGGQDNNGVSYNEVHGGHLYNNKINELHDAAYASGGWTTENSIHTVRHSHNSGEKVSGGIAPGTRHIKIAVQAVGFEINNNTWYSPSLESPGVVELAVEIESRGVTALREAEDNRFIQSRFEFTGGQPHIQQGGRNNFFDNGKNIPYIVWTYTTGYTLGRWDGSGVSYLPAFSGNGGQILENVDGSTAGFAVQTVLRPGGMAAGDAVSTAYVKRVSASTTQWKRSTDANERVAVDAVNGRVYFGTGTSAPVNYFGSISSSTIAVVGHLGWPTDNTYDIGIATVRPRDIMLAGKATIGTAQYRNGTGSPEGVVTAPVGSLYTRSDGGAGTTLYVKESGAGNTGWVAK